MTGMQHQLLIILALTVKKSGNFDAIANIQTSHGCR
jgi:hypothetical protein